MSEPTASLDVALTHASRLLATDPALAGEQASEILRVVDHPLAALVLGASHRACGRIAEAIAVLAPLARAQPNSAQTHLEFGLALGQAGRGDDALAALQRAVALKPDLPQAWLALADHRHATGDARGAETAYAAYVRHATRDPRLLQAAMALHEGRLPDAEAMLRDHLKQAPTDVAAIRMLAELAIRIGRHEDAESLLERCLELAPSFREARQNYALVLHRDHQPEKALAQLDMLLADDPAHSGSRALKAAILCRIGEYAQGIALYDEILREYPNNPRIWMSYGHALRTAGRQEATIAAYRKSIALDPGFGEAYWSLANLKTFRFSDTELDDMRRQLRRADLDDEHRLHFEFAIGKALEDRAEYDASFRHYDAGNRLRLASVPYGADEHAKRIARAKRTYTREFFRERAGFGDDAADPIFIVGLPRSGSTLLEQILSSHSMVEGTMELPEILSMTRALHRDAQAIDENLGYHGLLQRMDAEQLRDLGRQYLARTRIHRKTDARLFIDKMPNNFLHIGLIHLMLPNAKIIDARRHPMACCFSGFKQHFARGQNFSYGLENIGRYYRDYVELMAHFDDALPGRVHRVIHEDLIEGTETQVRRLLDYCGLPFEEHCLRFFENDRPVRTASSEQVRRPINRDGVDQWRHYEPWLGPLKDALGPVLEMYPDAPDFGAAVDVSAAALT